MIEEGRLMGGEEVKVCELEGGREGGRKNMSSVLGSLVHLLSVWTLDGSVCYLVGEAHFCGDHL